MVFQTKPVLIFASFRNYWDITNSQCETITSQINLLKMNINIFST